MDTHNAVACDLKVLLSQWCLVKVTVQVACGPDRERFCYATLYKITAQSCNQGRLITVGILGLT